LSCDGLEFGLKSAETSTHRVPRRETRIRVESERLPHQDRNRIVMGDDSDTVDLVSVPHDMLTRFQCLSWFRYRCLH